MDTWHSVADINADCLTCGDVPAYRGMNPETYRRWARTHAATNPGHHVVVETTSARSYRA